MKTERNCEWPPLSSQDAANQPASQSVAHAASHLHYIISGRHLTWSRRWRGVAWRSCNLPLSPSPPPTLCSPVRVQTVFFNISTPHFTHLKIPETALPDLCILNETHSRHPGNSSLWSWETVLMEACVLIVS